MHGSPGLRRLTLTTASRRDFALARQTLRSREGSLESFLPDLRSHCYMYPLRLLAFLGPYKRRAALALFCVIASSAAIIAMPQLIRWAIDYGLGPETQNDELVATGERQPARLSPQPPSSARRPSRASSPTARRTSASGSASASPTTSATASTTACSASPTPTTTSSRRAQLMSRATQDVEAVRWFVAMGVLRGFYVIAPARRRPRPHAHRRNWKLTLVVWAFMPVHRLALDGDGAHAAPDLDARCRTGWRGWPPCCRRRSPARASSRRSPARSTRARSSAARRRPSSRTRTRRAASRP